MKLSGRVWKYGDDVNTDVILLASLPWTRLKRRKAQVLQIENLKFEI